jgi:hypothetical protein
VCLSLGSRYVHSFQYSLVRVEIKWPKIVLRIVEKSRAELRQHIAKCGVCVLHVVTSIAPTSTYGKVF